MTTYGSAVAFNTAAWFAVRGVVVLFGMVAAETGRRKTPRPLCESACSIAGEAARGWDKIVELTFRDCFSAALSGATNDPIVIDGHSVSGLYDLILASKPTYTALDHLARQLR
jgi:hypothetical protein